ncbi:helix-turn-helix domain-containing protein [Paenibacillus polymyxa]
MEEKNDKSVISEDEFTKLLTAAKNKDPEAILKLLELYKADIQKLSRYIYLPAEDVASEIIVEFLELLQYESEIQERVLALDEGSEP